MVPARDRHLERDITCVYCRHRDPKRYTHVHTSLVRECVHTYLDVYINQNLNRKQGSPGKARAGGGVLGLVRRWSGLSKEGL